MSEPLKEFIQLINLLLLWSGVPSRGLEARRVVYRHRRCCCSVFLSISSCFFQQGSLSLCSCRLTRVQICVQRSVTQPARLSFFLYLPLPLSRFTLSIYLSIFVIFLHAFQFHSVPSSVSIQHHNPLSLISLFPPSLTLSLPPSVPGVNQLCQNHMLQQPDS